MVISRHFTKHHEGDTGSGDLSVAVIAGMLEILSYIQYYTVKRGIVESVPRIQADILSLILSGKH